MPFQVGGRDFAIDLLFFHRGLNCLLVVELKVGRFKPEYLGKLGFYQEVLDGDHREEHEHPSIGLLRCAAKNDEVVEYALSRSLTPALIAQYPTHLPGKGLLEANCTNFMHAMRRCRPTRREFLQVQPVLLVLHGRARCADGDLARQYP